MAEKSSIFFNLRSSYISLFSYSYALCGIPSLLSRTAKQGSLPFLAALFLSCFLVKQIKIDGNVMQTF